MADLFGVAVGAGAGQSIVDGVDLWSNGVDVGVLVTERLLACVRSSGDAVGSVLTKESTGRDSVSRRQMAGHRGVFLGEGSVSVGSTCGNGAPRSDSCRKAGC